ncbi:MAG: methyltransferase domain-containing protein [Planctomycetota bacterium]|nr:methyltransferase domain-containing protein [Planctomycetota bacterium]
MSLPASFTPAPGQSLRELSFPFDGFPVRLLVPVDPNAVAVEDDSPDNSVNEVHWAESWPAGVALAGALLEGAIPLPDGPEPILELGCGVGLAAVVIAHLLKTRAAAGRPGPRKLIASDIEPRALELTRENARRHGVEDFLETLKLDWSDAEAYAGRHRMIVAADALYHPDAGWQLAAFLRRALTPEPSSLAVLVDPDRFSARDFDQAARDAGFAVKHQRRPVPFTGASGPQMEMPRSGPPTDGEVKPDESIRVRFYELRFPS